MCNLAFGEEGDGDGYDGVVVYCDHLIHQGPTESLDSGCGAREPYFGDA